MVRTNVDAFASSDLPGPTDDRRRPTAARLLESCLPRLHTSARIGHLPGDDMRQRHTFRPPPAVAAEPHVPAASGSKAGRGERRLVWRYVDIYKEMYTLRHMPPKGASRQVLRLARRRGSITRRELIKSGIHTQTLSRLVRVGSIERVGRGLYRLPAAPITENHGLALVAAAVPKAVVCLVSALRFHEIGTQLPHEVWIALERRSRGPALAWPRLRVHRFSGKALTEGIETHRIEGESVKVYNVAKTVADVFKFRNKIGLDVALEALREAWRARRFTMDEIHRYARLCHVERVMRPYLEALVG